MRDLILFGEMGAGKDEVARILKENCRRATQTGRRG